jgi:hypothetical protein
VELVVVALCLIRPSDLLTIDYGWTKTTKKYKNAMPCLCGFPNCAKYFIRRPNSSPSLYSLGYSVMLSMSASVEEGLKLYLHSCYSTTPKKTCDALLTNTSDNKKDVISFITTQHSINNRHVSTAVKIYWSTVDEFPSPFLYNDFNNNRTDAEEHVFRNYKYFYDRLLVLCGLAAD